MSTVKEESKHIFDYDISSKAYIKIKRLVAGEDIFLNEQSRYVPSLSLVDGILNIIKLDTPYAPNAPSVFLITNITEFITKRDLICEFVELLFEKAVIKLFEDSTPLNKKDWEIYNFVKIEEVRRYSNGFIADPYSKKFLHRDAHSIVFAHTYIDSENIVGGDFIFFNDEEFMKDSHLGFNDLYEPWKTEETERFTTEQCIASVKDEWVTLFENEEVKSKYIAVVPTSAASASFSQYEYIPIFFVNNTRIGHGITDVSFPDKTKTSKRAYHRCQLTIKPGVFVKKYLPFHDPSKHKPYPAIGNKGIP